MRPTSIMLLRALSAVAADPVTVSAHRTAARGRRSSTGAADFARARAEAGDTPANASGGGGGNGG